MQQGTPRFASARALVWFKRDLRLEDHAPLAAAQHFELALALYVIEPEWLRSPECSAAKVQFALDSLAPLRSALHQRGLPLLVRVGNATAVLTELFAKTPFTHLLSHEETGPRWSYQRDMAVAGWCAAHGVAWQEYTQTGVVRRLRSRSGWARRWQARMDAPQLVLQGGFAGVPGLEQSDLPTLRTLGLGPMTAQAQPAGETAAHSTLESFLHGRGRDYRRAMSSPLTAPDACSRLSAHLAFGTVSLRTVHQRTEQAIRALRQQAHAPPPGTRPDADTEGHAHAVAGADGPAGGTPRSASNVQQHDWALAQSLRSFGGRLRWHCHFMQKLEDQPSIEFENFARVCDGLRENDFDTQRFDAWCAGQTGYPMVDACMRSLTTTGWLNFRMRAMLVSFAAYHLWLHWRPTGLFLARQFVDFEAGIHWSQMQMQSGTTGINTLRIYSPTKQAHDQDPEGHFIRRWVPELAHVPLPYLAEPWKMNDTLQRMSACTIGRDYPVPIVDDKAAVKAAKDRLYALRQTREAREEADVVQSRHGSRRSGLPPSFQRKRATPRMPAGTAPRMSDAATTQTAAHATHVQGDLFGLDLPSLADAP
jgi:deoxyribodipyrimidine photo-lyase